MKSLRSRIVMVAVIVQIIMLAILLSNTIRLINEEGQRGLHSRVAELEPLLSAALSASVFNRDYAALQDTLNHLLDKNSDSGLIGIEIYTPDQKLYAKFGDKWVSSDANRKDLDKISLENPYYQGNTPLLLGDIAVGQVFYVLSLKNTLLVQRDVTYQGLLIAFIEVLLSMVLLSSITYWLLRNLEKLIRASASLESGYFDVSVKIDSKDEVGLLGESFNRMSRAITQRNLALQTEITERKQSELALKEREAQLRTLFEALPDLIWLKDPDGVYLSCNHKFERFFGASEAEIVGKTDYEFVEQELADFFRANDKAAIKNDRPSINEEEVTYADDAHTEMLETVKVPMRTHDGKLIGVLGIGRDITERKQAEELLRRAQKMDAIGELSGGIAHDFNNILGIIQGNLDLMELRIGDDEALKKRLDTIQKSTQRAIDLTKQLLGFSRHQAKRVTSSHINQEILEMENLIARSVTPQVEVEQILAPDLWFTLIDPGDFQDALLNLIINARDAMAGPGKLSLQTSNCVLDSHYCSLTPGAKPGKYVQLSVSDTGQGIEPEYKERIFEPFFTTKERGKGTGLGLAMVYGFVKRSEGHITVNSEPHLGTTFKIYLPKSHESHYHTEPEVSQNKNLPDGSGTVLVVDDEPELLELAESYLNDIGYDVMTANHSQQALELLAQNGKINLLFSDVVMPGGMNGYELAEKARQLYPELKILLTSGYSDKATMIPHQNGYTAELLTKPYTQLELAQRIRYMLGKAEASN